MGDARLNALAETQFSAGLKVPAPNDCHFLLLARHVGAGEGEQGARIWRERAQANGPELPLLNLVFRAHERFAQFGRVCRGVYDVYEYVGSAHALRAWGAWVLAQQWQG